jgi:hypothetical protein
MTFEQRIALNVALCRLASPIALFGSIMTEIKLWAVRPRGRLRSTMANSRIVGNSYLIGIMEGLSATCQMGDMHNCKLQISSTIQRQPS